MPWWLSGLKTLCCHHCGTGLIPELGISVWPKKKKSSSSGDLLGMAWAKTDRGDLLREIASLCEWLWAKVAGKARQRGWI